LLIKVRAISTPSRGKNLRRNEKRTPLFIILMNRERALPDFLIIPYQVIADSELQPTDRLLYGLIYWYEHMKLEKCVASNETLAEILGVTARPIQGSLERLEKQGYIKRIFADPARKIRTEIQSLVRFRVRSNEHTGTLKRSYGVRSNEHHINKTYQKDLYHHEEKPKETLKTLAQRYPDLYQKKSA
jgi:hypothetical protein